jgi:hypothetical protein
MKYATALIGLGLVFAAVPLSGCVEDGYGYGGGVGWYSSPYDVWYDDYYGPIYDGYWGTDGYFYYRQNQYGHYRRGDHNHFRRDNDRFNGSNPGRFRRYEGNTQQPAQGVRTPHYPRMQGQTGGQYQHWRRH